MGAPETVIYLADRMLSAASHTVVPTTSSEFVTAIVLTSSDPSAFTAGIFVGGVLLRQKGQLTTAPFAVKPILIHVDDRLAPNDQRYLEEACCQL